MSRRITLQFGDQSFTAALLDTPMADAIWEALPLETGFSTWGDEIYFDTGVTVTPDQDQETVELGDVGYWPPGRALCLFYGPTPMSGPDEIRPAGPVAVFGRLEGDPKLLERVRAGRVRVSQAS